MRKLILSALFLSGCSPLVSLLNANECDVVGFLRCEGEVIIRCEQGIEVGESCGTQQCSEERQGCGVCGDGVTDSAFGEECDDGNTDDQDACTNACTLARCGDGIERLDITDPQDPAFEGCDDANSDNGDGCDILCKPTGCQNGFVNVEEVCLLPEVRFTVGDAPRSLTAGDIDLDGDLDLITANFGSLLQSGTISILLNDGTGNFTTLNLPTGVNPNAASVGDINNDGLPDIVIALSFPNEFVALKLGAGVVDGVPQFTDGVNVPTGADPTALDIGDINGDGNLDIAVTAFPINLFEQPRSVVLKFGDGAGNFPESDTATFVLEDLGMNPRSLALGDFNGDAIPDVILGDSRDENTLFLLQLARGEEGDISFARLTNLLDTGSNAVAVLFAPLDGDDLADFIAVNSVSQDLTVFLAPFEAPFFLPVANIPLAAGVGDVDADGRADIAVTGREPDELTLFLNRGTGFENVGTFPVGPQITPQNNIQAPSGVVVADFNGDGATDLAVVNFNDDSVSLLLSAP